MHPKAYVVFTFLIKMAMIDSANIVNTVNSKIVNIEIINCTFL